MTAAFAAKLSSLQETIEAVTWSPAERTLILGLLRQTEGVPDRDRLGQFALAFQKAHDAKRNAGNNDNVHLIYELLFHLCKDYAAPPEAAFGAADAERAQKRLADLRNELEKREKSINALQELLVLAHREVLAYQEAVTGVKMPQYTIGAMDDCRGMSTTTLLQKMEEQKNASVDRTAIDAMRNKQDWPTSTLEAALMYFGGTNASGVGQSGGTGMTVEEVEGYQTPSSGPMRRSNKPGRLGAMEPTGFFHPY